MKKLHDAKKSLKLNIIYGMILLLQFLCYLTPIVGSFCHFWQQFSMTVVCTSVRIKNVLMQQNEVILLLFLLRLLCITLCTQFLHLALMGMVIMLSAPRIVAYLLHFFILRHRRIMWTGAKLVANVFMAALFHLMEHEEIIFPLVRAALLVTTCITTSLLLCLHDGMMACGPHTEKRPEIFTGNPAFGGRGPGVRRVKKRKTSKKRKGRIFDSTRGFPGEGWAQLRFATWNTRGLTFQRFKYCQQLNYDVLALTELWRGQHKYLSKNNTSSHPHQRL